MGTKYVRKTGNDGNAGTSAGAAWLTIGKALGASGMADGDTLYIGAGTYRETVTVSFTPTVTTSIIGDVDGAQTGDAGDVILTSYKNTGGDVGDGAGACLTLNGKSFLTFDSIQFYGSGPTINGDISHSHDITFQRCMAVVVGPSGWQVITYTNLANTAANWVIDRCIFAAHGTGGGIVVTTADPNVASDRDLNFLVKNTFILGATGHGIRVIGPASLGNTGKPGGVRARNVTIYGVGGNGFSTTTTNMSTGIPCEIYNSMVIIAGAVGVAAGAASQVLEDFNLIITGTPRSNVTAGTSSVTGSQHCPLIELGQSYLVGRMARPPFSLMTGAPQLGFGGTGSYSAFTQDQLTRPRPSGGAIASTQATDTGTATGTQTSTTLQDTGKSWTVNAFAGYRVKLTGGTGSGQQRYVVSNTSNTLTVDFAWGTTPVAASTTYSVFNPGDQTGIGCFDRHDFAVKDTGTVDVSPSIKILGSGDHDLLIPVDAVSTTISIKVQRDGNYGAGTKPQITLIANGEIGVVTQTVTDTAAASQWNTLTLSAFTPTAKGVVKLRLAASGSTGIGNTFWDTLAIS